MTYENINILILRLSSIGDILLTSAFVRQVRKKFPSATISYIVKKEFQSLLKHNPNINNVIGFDSTDKNQSLKSVNLNLKKSNFDLIFDLHNNIRTNIMLKGISPSKIFKIKKEKFKRAVLVYLKTNLYDEIKTIPQRYLNVGGIAAIADDGSGLELFLSEEINEKNKNTLFEYGLTPGKFICIGPGAAHYTKMWPIENYESLMATITKNTGYKVVILGSLAEKGLLNFPKKNSDIIELSGRLNLLESAAVISSSAGIVSNDSGLMHMAVAVNKPVVAIFGSTVRELGFYPYRADATVIENKLWCRPCSHVGKKSCPLGHFKCMRLTKPEYVFDQVKRKLLK